MVNWYTADPHFGPENIIKFCKRPFHSTAHMGKVLLGNLQACVGDDDDLWILGDLVVGPRAKSRHFLHSLFGLLPNRRRHLVTGNHDKELVLSLPWDTVTPLAEVRDGPKNQNYTLCHYPMLTWNHVRRDALMMFCHVHDNWPGYRNCVNVGVDLWGFKPALFEDIAARGAVLPARPHWAAVEPS
ncbi:Calcineurin-like phosphoesterase superfamily protein [Loktanella atrilutea]|uniref:Calcineurin-like phosphoesterase superfamily protein n=1 Tax=Loktanella atrilutea TaxID=366533 RepID=A0A1M5F9X3_LOKAT|nr:metallophosphoesterase [Loktanella atrilutea]SHF88198.1 Calcineurin-like phosphoesterase superfamily protein [Loktanella atrilutea]